MTDAIEKLAEVIENAIDSVHDMDVTHRDYAEASARAVLAALPDRSDRYGNVKVIKIVAAFNELRDACRSEGTPRIQEAIDRYEPWADYVMQEVSNDT